MWRRAGAALSALLLASCLAPGAASAQTSGDVLMLYRATSWNFTVSVSGAGTLELVDVDPGEPLEPQPFPTPEEIEEMLGKPGGTEQAAFPGTPGGARQAPATAAPAGTAGTAGAATARALSFGAAPSVQAAEPALGPNGAPLPTPGTLLRDEALTFSVAKNSMLTFRFTPDSGAHIVALSIAGQDVMDRLGPDNTIALAAADAKVALEAVFSQAAAGGPGPAGSGTDTGTGPLSITGDGLLNPATLAALAAVALAAAALALFLTSRRRAATTATTTAAGTTAAGCDTSTTSTTTTTRDGNGGDRMHAAAACPSPPGIPHSPGAAPHSPGPAKAGPGAASDSPGAPDASREGV